MRIAIVSDIHGNRTAFEAVLADLRQTSPDLILHGGDWQTAVPARGDRGLGGHLGWQGVLGNTDEMLASPDSLTTFSRQSPHLKALFKVIEEVSLATRELLGEERLGWLGNLPSVLHQGPLALVHASPESPCARPGTGSLRCRA